MRLAPRCQAGGSRTAFRALSPLGNEGWFRGIWWWEWSAEGLGIGPGAGSFSPEGKRASVVLEEWQR